jgi:hypothetical protein
VTSLFTAREGRPVPDGPFEGVPPHLRQQLIGWLLDVYTSTPPDALSRRIDVVGLELVAALLRIDLTGLDSDGPFPTIIGWASSDDERFLDLLHYTLQFPSKVGTAWKKLEILLALGGSVWRATEKGLELRVDPTAGAAFDQASQTSDASSDDLSEAWGKAYGRHPNASDAWDHAIKACEAILIPIVVPKQTRATLGHVVQHLRTQGHLWKLLVAGPETNYDFAPLVGMLDVIWPNPDRHADPKDRRTPTIEETRAVVQLAVTIVQWARDGQIMRR